MQPLRHLLDVLDQFKQRSQRSDAYNLRQDEKWISYSSEKILNDIESLALALENLNIKKGDRVAICAKSSPNWSIADFAIILAGGVTVPLFSNLSEQHFVFEVTQSTPSWIFVGDKEGFEVIKRHKSLFQGTISLENELFEDPILTLGQLIKKGDEIKNKDPEKLESLKRRIEPEDLATIIYSSGSTGNPKGVELTHKNLTSIIHFDEFELHSEDKYLNILPLAHIFAKQIHLIMTAWGVPVYFLNDLKKIPQACQEVPITRMITVPRVLEKAYSKMCEKVKNSPFIKRLLGKWSFDLAERKNGLYKKLMHPIADKLVYSKIRNAFGKHFHSIVSGGAPLNPRLHQFYLSVGIPIIQGWGLTEASTICINRLSDNKTGTCGFPLENTEFKISDEGEVLVRGPTVMRGYHKNKEATEKALDKDGWLHTGDSGYFDQDKHLVILGRINDSFKTSHGEFVNPVPIEQKLVQSPFVDMAMVVGEGFPRPAALLFPNTEALQALKKEQNLSDLSDAQYLETEGAVAEMTAFLEKMNLELDEWQRIRNYRFIFTPPSIESGEFTPTLKLRRKVVSQKYQDLIKSMYV